MLSKGLSIRIKKEKIFHLRLNFIFWRFLGPCAKGLTLFDQDKYLGLYLPLPPQIIIVTPLPLFGFSLLPLSPFPPTPWILTLFDRDRRLGLYLPLPPLAKAYRNSTPPSLIWCLPPPSLPFLLYDELFQVQKTFQGPHGMCDKPSFMMFILII